ncbi:MAG: glutamate racemase [Proteobacteria bacterium]|nr:glutamate racemase [Pseudomonadota bacterium]
MKNNAIGIFDSGVGGLTVLHSIVSRLPYENTVYVGDTARVPYGTKSARTVTQYAIGIGEFLSHIPVKALVVACNTASAFALDALRGRFDLPIVGMIDPAARRAVAASKNGRIGVIGTVGTVKSGAYGRAIKHISPDVEVLAHACPLFVPLAEEGWLSNDIARLSAQKYLEPMKRHGVDTVILGCTHYPLLKEVISEVLGEGVTLVDSGDEAALDLEGLLVDRGLHRKGGGASHRFYVTDTPDRFVEVGESFLGGRLSDVSHVDIP